MEYSTKNDKIKNYLLDALTYVVGSFIFAVSVNTFTAPNNIISAGITGVATMINYIWNLPIGITIIVLNIPLFIWGILRMGYNFIIKTIVATLISSLMIDITASILPKYTGDQLLACIFGGILLGVGLALIFIRGGTTGGTDLIAGIIGSYIRSISIGRLILIQDVIIVISAAFVYNSFESSLYAIIVIYVNTKIIDMMLYGNDSGSGRVMFIISRHNEDIAKAIMENIGRGVTAIKSRGIYENYDGEMLLCAVSRQQVYKTYDIIHSIDKNAFIIVGDVREIRGEGFKNNENVL